MSGIETVPDNPADPRAQRRVLAAMYLALMLVTAAMLWSPNTRDDHSPRVDDRGGDSDRHRGRRRTAQGASQVVRQR